MAINHFEVFPYIGMQYSHTWFYTFANLGFLKAIDDSHAHSATNIQQLLVRPHSDIILKAHLD